jgi:hypothetical protein
MGTDSMEEDDDENGEEEEKAEEEWCGKNIEIEEGKRKVDGGE